MGTRQLNRLAAKTVAKSKTPGYYCDGGGLYLQVTPSGTKSWIFRYRSPVTSKLRDMGLGPLLSVSLPEARTKAAAQRKALLAGLDPIHEREVQVSRKAVEAAKAMTFSTCAGAFIASHQAGWRNAKHAQQWKNTLQTYCDPIFGGLPVQDVDTTLVLAALEPIWSRKPETATRVRSRIENVLDWAKARGYRGGENPARWRGHLAQLLPVLPKKHRVKHHKALPFPEARGFMDSLRQRTGVAAKCLEFTVLTAVRTSEAINAKASEFDLAQSVWTIPASRMKAKAEHRVPLSNRAVEIVKELMAPGKDHVFAIRDDKPISNMAMLNLLERMDVDVTVHGFRSSFRDWAAERTAFPHEVCEMALAHTIPNTAEAAYRRGDLLEKRRILMESWAKFLSEPQLEATVLPLREAA